MPDLPLHPENGAASTPPVPPKGSGTCRWGWLLIKAWACCLLLAAIAGLAAYWLETASPPVSGPEPPLPTDSAPSIGALTAPTAEIREAPPGKQDAAQDQVLRPRTVEEMLHDIPSEPDLIPSPPAFTPQVTAPAPAPPDFEVDSLPEETGADMPDMTDDLVSLLREARAAQIEGDLRRSVIKLEQAWELAPDNPVVCYYFGLTYEFLRNAAKSREYFSKVIAQADRAGKYRELAALHLERGFSTPADTRGDISFGTILEYREPDTGDGQRVILTIPILMKEGINIRPEDLYIPVQFFHAVNGKDIDAYQHENETRWITEPVDWKEGEEIREIRFYSHPLTPEEITAYGDRKYYGYTAKLYYKGEPMDCRASPPVLLLIEQKNNRNRFNDYFQDDTLLPPAPLDATPVSDLIDPSMPVEPYGDQGLLPP